VDGWDRSPAVAAVAVTAVPVAALIAGPVFRGLRAGTRSEAVAGSVLIAGGLTGLALLPGAELVWTLAPQVLVGLGLVRANLQIAAFLRANDANLHGAKCLQRGESPRPSHPLQPVETAGIEPASAVA
jgi:hypothetical protein